MEKDRTSIVLEDGTSSAGFRSSSAGAEDVQQTPALFVLCADSTRRAHWWILLYGGYSCAVESRLLDSVVEGATTNVRPGEQMAPLHHGRA